MRLRRWAFGWCATALCATGVWVAAARAADPTMTPVPATTKAAADPFAPPAWVRSATRPSGRPAKPGPRPVDGVDHVVLISVDGCRPDLLLRGDTPNLHALFRGGAYTFWAKTTPNANTLPSHTSMLTGVAPRKHGIEWNRDLPLARPLYSNAPTVFYQAKRHGYRTGMAAGKSKFDFLTVPGTLDYESVPEKTGKDTDVAVAAAKILTSEKPDVMFVHLPGNDGAGHKFGWGTPEQMAALADADAAVGVVLAALGDAGLDQRTVVIVTADHGGAGKNHLPEDARSRHIPWIVSGPGVRAGLDLTTDAELEVRTEDSFATICWLLGIPLDPKLDGKPVAAAFKAPAPDKPKGTAAKDAGTADAELLRDAPAATTAKP